MQKYRRKGEIVDAQFHPRGWKGSEGVGDVSPIYTRVIEGCLHFYPKDEFEREYERIGGANDIVYICNACGDKLRAGLTDGVMDKGRILCLSCYQRLIERERVEEKASLRHCKACGCHMALGGEYELNGVGPYCSACYVLLKMDKKPKPVASLYIQCAGCGAWLEMRGQNFDAPIVTSIDYYCQPCSDAKKIGRAKCCFACGKSLVPGTAFREKEASSERFCYDCWQARKTPKPLTLGDLQPGDVFRFASYSRGERCQILSVSDKPRRYGSPHHALVFYSDGGLGWPCVADIDTGPPSLSHISPSPFALIRHHRLTPEQLLWIDASAEEREALEGSIRDNWLPRMLDGEARECPLCLLDHDHARDSYVRCTGKCIIARYTGRRECIDTPYYDAVLRGPAHYPRRRAEALFLAEFLPQIHPLRIEVEDTPVEWPGATK